MNVDRERIESKIMHIKSSLKKLRKFQEIFTRYLSQK